MHTIEELKRQKRINGLNENITKQEIKMLYNNTPIQKIIGFVNFNNLRINVNHNVFIPRYETEEVVMEAIKYVNNDTKVLDLCCGSGYIGLTIKQKTQADVTLSDIDNSAILQTYENAIINNLKVKIIKSNLLNNIKEKFDIIVCNPPYIPQKTILPKTVINFEPSLSLFGGEDGNDFYKKIIIQSRPKINNNGYLVFEISPFNSKFLLKKGFKIIQDINGKDRIAIKKMNHYKQKNK